MKICFLAAADSIHSKKWVEYFAKQGHEVHWLSLTPNHFGNIEGVKFYQLKEFSRKSLDILLNALPARRLIKKINPDILHLHYAGVNGALGVLSGFRPFILTVWGSDILFVAKEKIRGFFVRLALKKAALITCDAYHMQEAMKKLGVPESKIKIIYFGIDTQKFNQKSIEAELRKKKLGVFGCPTVISLRNLNPVYNIETLIKAIPFVLKEIPTVKFLIAGRGSEEEMLRNSAKELGVLEAINFIGFIPNDELPSYFWASDVYVSTSLSDAGLSSSTAEAMACKLPVVITNTGENERWVEDGKSGYLIPVKNPEILAEKIVQLLKDKNLRVRLGEVGRKIIEERNDYYGEMARMEELCKKIIQSK